MTIAALLAMVAGFVDAYGIITYGVYLSFMSGNPTQTGYQTAEGAVWSCLYSRRWAILFFVGGAFAPNWRRPRSRSATAGLRRLRPSLGNGRLPDFHCKSSGSVCSEGQDRF